MTHSKDELYKMYVDERMSIPMISSAIGVPKSTVRNWLVRFEIPLRSSKEAICDYYGLGRNKCKKKKKRQFSEAEKRRIVDSYKRWADEHAKGLSLKPNGYLEVTRGENKGRGEHVVIMEAHIGRRIKKGEIVHHINGNRSDNRIENLRLMTRSEHSRLHNIEKLKKGIHPFQKIKESCI